MYLYIKRSFISVFKSRAKAEVINRRPPRRHSFDHGTPCKVMVGRVALGWVCLRVLRFSPVSVISPTAPYLSASQYCH